MEIEGGGIALIIAVTDFDMHWILSYEKPEKRLRYSILMISSPTDGIVLGPLHFGLPLFAHLLLAHSATHLEMGKIATHGNLMRHYHSRIYGQLLDFRIPVLLFDGLSQTVIFDLEGFDVKVLDVVLTSPFVLLF